MPHALEGWYFDLYTDNEMAAETPGVFFISFANTSPIRFIPDHFEEDQFDVIEEIFNGVCDLVEAMENTFEIHGHDQAQRIMWKCIDMNLRPCVFPWGSWNATSVSIFSHGAGARFLESLRR